MIDAFSSYPLDLLRSLWDRYVDTEHVEFYISGSRTLLFRMIGFSATVVPTPHHVPLLAAGLVVSRALR